MVLAAGDVTEFLSIDLTTIIATLLNTLILFLVLKHFLFDKVNKVIEDRKNDVKETYRQADEAKENAQKLEAEYTSRLEGAKEESAQIIQTATRKAQQRSDEIISEAESMRNYLLRCGVPESAIIMEPRSTTTRENMAFSKALMDENGYESALIVTSDYHLWRAMRLADRAGISGSCAGARNSSNIFFTVKNLARETLSWIKFALTD